MGMRDISSKKVWSVGTLNYTFAGLLVLFLWLMWGDFAWSLKVRAVDPVTQVMLKGFDISNFAYGILAITIPQFTNIYLCPIIGYISDRHRGRYGRRIPFIAFTTPFVVIGLIGVGMSPIFGRWLQQAIGPERISLGTACIACFSVFWLIHDFGNTLALNLFNALVNDVVPEKLLGRFNGWFRAVSLGCAFLFQYYIFGYSKTHVTVILVGMALLYGVGMMSLCLKVKEGEYPPVPEIPEEEKKRKGSLVRSFIRGTKTYMVESFAHPYYRWVIASIAFPALAILPIHMYAIFFAQDLGMDMAYYGKILAMVSVISFVMSFFLGWFADKFHPVRMAFVSILLLTVFFFLGGVWGTTQKGLAFYIMMTEILFMAYNTLTASYAQRLFPKRLFAQFASAAALCSSLGLMLLSGLAGEYFDLVKQYFGTPHYEHAFYIGGGFSVLCLICLARVYHYFKQYGGDDHYQAPDEMNGIERVKINP